MARLLRRSSPRPLHPPLTDFPVALWGTSLVFDLLSLWIGNSMVLAAFYNVAAGCVIALFAMLTGTLDYNRIPDRSPARRIGLLHALLNVSAFTLFAVNLWLRSRYLTASNTPLEPVVLSAVGLFFIGISSALGSHMVFEHGVGVEPVVGRRERPVSDLREPVRP